MRINRKPIEFRRISYALSAEKKCAIEKALSEILGSKVEISEIEELLYCGLYGDRHVVMNMYIGEDQSDDFDESLDCDPLVLY